jgi:hypothetical protein
MRFEPGMRGLFDGYLVMLKEGKESYDGWKVRKLIDVFGEVLSKHLREEVETLGLKKFDQIDWNAYAKKVSKDAVATAEAVSSRMVAKMKDKLTRF